MAECGAAAGGGDQAGDLSQPADDARDDHGVFRADDGSAGRVWKLFSADSDWRAGYGVSGAEHAFVLDDVCRVRDHHRGIFRNGRSAAAWVDWIRSVECAAVGGAGRGVGRGFVDHEHCDFLRRVVDGGVELYYDYARSAGEGHDYDAHAADRLVVVHHGDFGIAGVWRVALGGNSAIDGSEFGDEFLCAAGGGERADHGAQGRIAAAVAASVLVLRTSGGLHCDPAGDGRGFAGFVDVLAQTDFWI